MRSFLWAPITPVGLFGEQRKTRFGFLRRISSRSLSAQRKEPSLTAEITLVQLLFLCVMQGIRRFKDTHRAKSPPIGKQY